jgi:hypothetical protein
MSILFNSEDEKKKREDWTYLYSDEEINEMFKFIEENIYDLSYYKINKWKFGPDHIKKNKKNKKWVIQTYTDLRDYYAKTATEFVIEYVNTFFQRGLTRVLRPTLNVLILLFGPYIVEKFERDFSMDNLEKIVLEEFHSIRYENSAYLITKEHADVEKNVRIHYQPKMGNSLESKKEVLKIVNPIMALAAFRGETGILQHYNDKSRNEMRHYTEASYKNWSPCLPNEKEYLPGKCSKIRYLREDITDEDIVAMKDEIAEVTNILIPSKNESEKKNVFKKYKFSKYIVDPNQDKSTVLKKYSKELKLDVSNIKNMEELSFLILMNQFSSPIVNYVKKHSPSVVLPHIDNLANYIKVISIILPFWWKDKNLIAKDGKDVVELLGKSMVTSSLISYLITAFF